MDTKPNLTTEVFGGHKNNYFFPDPESIAQEMKLFPPSPCLACGCNCFDTWESQDFPICCSEDELLSHLCQFLKAPLTECGYWGYPDEVPLCNACRYQLLRLVDLKGQILELERELELSSSEFMRMCKQSEHKLEKSGIYGRDERYINIRKIFKSDSLQEVDENGGICEALTLSRKTVRNESISAMAIWSPVVPISNEERTACEESHVKPKAVNMLWNVNEKVDAIQAQAHSFKPAKISKTVVEATSKQQPWKDTNGVTNELYDDCQSDSDVDAVEKVKNKGQNLKSGERLKVERDPVTDSLKFMDVAFTIVGPDKYSCDVCGTEVKIKCQMGNTEIRYRYDGLRNHVIQFHSDTCKCPHCGFKSPGSRALRQHIDCMHNGIKPNRKSQTCTICGKPCDSVPRMRYHMWTHYSDDDKREAIANGEKIPKNYDACRYQCAECGKPYKSPSSLTFHTLSVHTDKSKITYDLCPICGRCVASYRMKEHTSRYHPSESFKCPHCDKEFPTRRALRDHRYTHEELPYKCEVCGRRFRQKINWISHTNLHKGVRPYPCPYCSMRFPAKLNIAKHIRTFHLVGSKPRVRALPAGLYANENPEPAETIIGNHSLIS